MVPRKQSGLLGFPPVSPPRALCRHAAVLKKAGCGYPARSFFVHLFTQRTIARVCDVPGTGVKVHFLISSQSPLLIFTVYQTPGLFSVGPGRTWLEGGLVRPR